jgi:hypothetical protein
MIAPGPPAVRVDPKNLIHAAGARGSDWLGLAV